MYERTSSGHSHKDERFGAMDFTNFIRSYDNCEENALYYSNFNTAIHSESVIFGTVVTPDVWRTP